MSISFSFKEKKNLIWTGAMLVLAFGMLGIDALLAATETGLIALLQQFLDFLFY